MTTQRPLWLNREVLIVGTTLLGLGTYAYTNPDIDQFGQNEQVESAETIDDRELNSTESAGLLGASLVERLELLY